ncbi:MAG: glycosyltransferase [Actinomycetales bacterium]|nr:glycosyltransferase [Actinomycetales bacterium]
MHSPTIAFLLADSISAKAEDELRLSVPKEHRASLSFTRVDVASVSEINAILASLTCEFVAIVHSPLTFETRAFALLISALQAIQVPDVTYADSVEERPGSTGTVILRPDFSPERLRSQNYLGDVLVYRTSFLQGIGGVRQGLGSATFFDLALRATAQAKLVSHVASVLYRSSNSQGAVFREHELRHALNDHLEATGGGRVVSVGINGVYDTRREVKGKPLVSIVIPTRGVSTVYDGTESCLVVDAVRSVIEKTTYENFEIVVVVDSVAEPKVLDALKTIAGTRLRLVEWKHPFNFSQKMNYGVLHAEGEFVLLLNDDVQVLTGEWLESMLALAQLPNAGMVGAMLYYDDDTIQHAGHAYYQGSPTHIGLGVPRGSAGPGNGYLVEREVSGVTAACAIMPLAVFTAVGGFTALLPGNFNDVDLCLKVGWKGYDIYWTPHAELYHFESKTRDAHVHFYELDVIEHRWGLRLDDPRYWRGHPESAV